MLCFPIIRFLCRNSPTQTRTTSFLRFWDNTQTHVIQTPSDEDRPFTGTSSWQLTTRTKERHLRLGVIFFFGTKHTFIQVHCLHSSTYITDTVSIVPEVRVFQRQGTLSLPHTTVIRTRNPSMRTAADPCFRPRGHRKRHFLLILS